MNNKTRFALYVDEATLDEARELCKDESISSFIEKAIHFYCGYLRSEAAENYLPPLFRKYLMTGIDYFCDRIGRLMYKMAVETNITNRLLADDVDMSFKDLEELREEAVFDVERTNGEINFEEVVERRRGKEKRDY